MGNTESILKSIRLKKEVINKIEKMAENNNRSFTNMVETILINTPVESRV